MKLNLIVIRTSNPEELKCQYEILGLQFEYHRHGNGPFHYASEHKGVVFEIYPLTKSMTQADSNLRLGFEVEDLKDKMLLIERSNWVVKSELKIMEWGEVAVIQDLDGRKVEVKVKQ